MNYIYIHHTSRRPRVRILALKANAKAAQELQNALREINSVVSVETNLLIGSVLVNYDCEKRTSERVRTYIRSRHFWPSPELDAAKATNVCSHCSPAAKITCAEVIESVLTHLTGVM